MISKPFKPARAMTLLRWLFPGRRVLGVEAKPRARHSDSPAPLIASTYLTGPAPRAQAAASVVSRGRRYPRSRRHAQKENAAATTPRPGPSRQNQGSAL